MSPCTQVSWEEKKINFLIKFFHQKSSPADNGQEGMQK